MTDVCGAVMQGRNKPFTSARNRKHAEIQAFADEEALALGNEKRQCVDAPQGGIGLRIAKRDALCARSEAGAQIERACTEAAQPNEPWARPETAMKHQEARTSRAFSIVWARIPDSGTRMHSAL
jgi:hypothetical protein